MRCIEASNIRRYVLGTMGDDEADQITQHLISCKSCRREVAELRGKTDPKGQNPAAELIKVKCSDCGARYGIPAERVRGRILKLRCKKCKNIIKVSGEASEGEVNTSVLERGRKLWFLVIKRQRVGPMTEQEVRERFERGDVKAKAYAWRQGFTKWDRLRNIPEFKELVASGLPAARGRISAAPTRKAEIDPDPDVTEKARRPQPRDEGSRDPKDSAELNFDEPIRDRLVDSAVKTACLDPADDAAHAAPTGLVPAEEPAAAAGLSDSDSGAMTAYRSDGELEDSGIRTAFRPPAGAETDAQQTRVHHKEDPVAVMGGESVASVTSSDPEAWQREFADEPPLPDELEKPQPSPRIDSGEWERHMKGERRENSVLFSLSHLQKLSSQPRAEQKGDTGLFQIKPLIGAPAAPLLLPQDPGAERRSGLGMVLGVAFIGVILGAGVLGGILYLVQPDLVRALISGQELVVEAQDRGNSSTPPPRALAAAPVAEVSPKTTTQPLAPAAVKVDAGAAPRRDQGSAATSIAAEAPDKGSVDAPRDRLRGRARRGKRRRHRRRRAARPTAVGADRVRELDKLEQDLAVPEASDVQADPPVPVTPAPAAAPAAKPGGSSKGELDDLISAATESKVKPTPKKASAAPPQPAKSELPRVLTRDQVSAGMRRANGRVKACYRMFKQAGTIMVRVTINGQTGKIRKAKISGAFAGTPSGDCVSAAVRLNTHFPRFSGPPLTLNYPYMLR